MPLTIFLSVLLACSNTTEAAIKTEGWIELTSKNFVIVTDLKEQEAIQKVNDLELFRSVLLKITNAKPPQSVIPSTTYISDGQKMGIRLKASESSIERRRLLTTFRVRRYVEELL